MKLNTNLAITGVSGLAVVVGVIIILASTGWGNAAANAYLRAGGPLATSTWSVMMQNYIASYRQLGLAILAGGIAGMLLVAWRRLH